MVQIGWSVKSPVTCSTFLYIFLLHHSTLKSKKSVILIYYQVSLLHQLPQRLKSMAKYFNYTFFQFLEHCALPKDWLLIREKSLWNISIFSIGRIIISEVVYSFIWSGSIIFFGVNMSLLTLNGYDDGRKFIQENMTLFNSLTESHNQV